VFAITASFLYNKNVINGDIISKVQSFVTAGIQNRIWYPSYHL